MIKKIMKKEQERTQNQRLKSATDKKKSNPMAQVVIVDPTGTKIMHKEKRSSRRSMHREHNET